MVTAAAAGPSNKDEKKVKRPRCEFGAVRLVIFIFGSGFRKGGGGRPYPFLDADLSSKRDTGTSRASGGEVSSVLESLGVYLKSASRDFLLVPYCAPHWLA